MEIYWWQGGIHINPKTKEDMDTLSTFMNILERADLNF